MRRRDGTRRNLGCSDSLGVSFIAYIRCLVFSFQTSQARNRATGAPHHSSRHPFSSARALRHTKARTKCLSVASPAPSGLLPRPTHSVHPIRPAMQPRPRFEVAGESHVLSCSQSNQAKKPKANPMRSRTGLDGLAKRVRCKTPKTRRATTLRAVPISFSSASHLTAVHSAGCPAPRFCLGIA